MNLYLYFFISGIVLGTSLCVVSCGLLLFPLIGRESSNWKEGVKNGLIFGLGRTLSSAFLGGVASFSHFLLQEFIESRFSFIGGGILLILFGFWFFFSENSHRKMFLKNLPFFSLGIIYGLIPCVPMTGFLLYLLYVSKGILFGIISGMVFGIGTTIGPMLILCGIFPHLWKKISHFQNARIYMKIIGSFIFFLWGINLLMKGLL